MDVLKYYNENIKNNSTVEYQRQLIKELTDTQIITRLEDDKKSFKDGIFCAVRTRAKVRELITLTEEEIEFRELNNHTKN